MEKRPVSGGQAPSAPNEDQYGGEPSTETAEPTEIEKIERVYR